MPGIVQHEFEYTSILAITMEAGNTREQSGTGAFGVAVDGTDVTFDGVLQARERIARHLPKTPLIRSTGLSDILEADVWLKVETISPIASFKARGALNHILLARSGGGCTGAVSSSTGNHGQGVAYAAKLAGIPSDIFLPIGSVAIKKRMIALFGGMVHEIGHDIDAAKEHARLFAIERNATFVDDGESVAMIEGAATVGLEVAEELAGIDYIYTPMGSGVLASGTGLAIKHRQPAAQVIAVQSQGSPAMVESFHARRPVEKPINTIADCIVCRVPARQALDGILRWVDDCRLVSDGELLSAMHTMLVLGHILVEPGAASVLARAYADKAKLKDKRVVLIATGANVDGEMIARALAKPPLGISL
jgi:threonine dehydratase